ncbi:MAG: hypothetical protein ACTSVU_01685 [Promethearchaeota archaeon]
MEKKQILLLEELFCNSRISAIFLSKFLKTSRQFAATLRNKLWMSGTIKSPTILINPNSLKSHYYFIFFSVNNLQDPRIKTKLIGLPETYMLNILIGKKNIISQFRVQNRKRFIEILKIFDSFIDDGLFSTYKVIEPFGFFKIGGFILKPCSQIHHLSKRRWDLLQLLKKNYNIRKWPLNDGEDLNFKPSDIEYLKKINIPREIARFEKEGIIQNYSIILKKPISRFATKYLIQLKPKLNSDYNKLISKLVKNPNIIELYRVGEELGILGVYCCNGKIPVQEIMQFLYHEYEIQTITIDLIIEELIESICPPTSRIAAKISKNEKWV